MSVDAIWIESSKGGKAAWSNRKLYIAVDAAALFLDAGNEGVEIISSGGDIYYPSEFLQGRPNSKEFTNMFNALLVRLYREVAEKLEDERQYER